MYNVQIIFCLSLWETLTYIISDYGALDEEQ